MKTYQVTWIEHHSTFVVADDEDTAREMVDILYLDLGESPTRVDYDELHIDEHKKGGGR